MAVIPFPYPNDLLLTRRVYNPVCSLTPLSGVRIFALHCLRNDLSRFQEAALTGLKATEVPLANSLVTGTYLSQLPVPMTNGFRNQSTETRSVTY